MKRFIIISLVVLLSSIFITLFVESVFIYPNTAKVYKNGTLYKTYNSEHRLNVTSNGESLILSTFDGSNTNYLFAGSSKIYTIEIEKQDYNKKRGKK